MSPIKIFLALLLGGYPLQQPGDFYSDILVKTSVDDESSQLEKPRLLEKLFSNEYYLPLSLN